MRIRYGENWIPRAIRYALGEPVVELVRQPGPVPAFYSDLDLPTTTDRLVLPLMDVEVEDPPSRPSPSRFLYHLPRSGSTLVARMLSEVPDTAVLVEVSTLNALLSSPQAGADLDRHLARLLLLYRSGLHAHYPHVVFKLSSWMCIQIDCFRAADPDAPGVFLYRHPGEVMVQILQRPTGWMEAGARAFVLGSRHEGVAELDTPQYCALAIERLIACAADPLHQALAVPYHRLAEYLPDRLAAWFGLSLREDVRHRMSHHWGRDTEDWSGKTTFRPDTEALRSSIDGETRALVDSRIRPTMLRLGLECPVD